MNLEKKIDDTKGKTGLHHVVNIAKNGRLVTEADMLQGLSGYHYTLWQELELQQRWNTKFYGKKGTADHIILPPALFDQKGIEYVNNSFKVFRKAYLFTKRGYINRWQYKKGKHRGKGYSDHLPIYAYFDTKPYRVGADIAALPKQRITKNIEYFYTKERLDNEVRLNDVIVIWKHKRNAIIKQTREGRGIFIYGAADHLEVGKRYDLLVRAVKTYKGLKELTHVYVLKQRGEEDISQYILQDEDLSKKVAYRQNEVFGELVGMYRNSHFYVKGREIPIYFKNKKTLPINGAKLKIHNALLGYYKKLQLVIYRTKDFTVLES